jgi:phage anti-repressor protein
MQILDAKGIEVNESNLPGEKKMNITNYRLTTEQFNTIQNQLQPKLEDGLIQSVDARRLHQWLGFNPGNFSDWMRTQIDRAGLVEHEDYEILLLPEQEQVWGGANRKDYALSPNAAKEIAMMSSSDKGKLIRNYFLDCELKLKLKKAIKSSST